MQYIDLINAFNKWCETNYLPSSAQLLWFKLINLFNGAGWSEWISVDNLRLMSIMQIRNEKTLIKCRDILIDENFFEYQKGKKGCPNRYKINTVNFTVKNTVNSTVLNTADNTVNNTDINRIRQDKDKNKKNNKKKYGEYQNVQFDDEQYEKLINEFPNDYEKRIQSLDDYIQSSGKKYKDHLATIRNWARKEGYKKPEKIEYQTVSTEGLTNEEYEKLLRERRKNV